MLSAKPPPIWQGALSWLLTLPDLLCLIHLGFALKITRFTASSLCSHANRWLTVSPHLHMIHTPWLLLSVPEAFSRKETWMQSCCSGNAYSMSADLMRATRLLCYLRVPWMKEPSKTPLYFVISHCWSDWDSSEAANLGDQVSTEPKLRISLTKDTLKLFSVIFIWQSFKHTMKGK